MHQYSHFFYVNLPFGNLVMRAGTATAANKCDGLRDNFIAAAERRGKMQRLIYPSLRTGARILLLKRCKCAIRRTKRAILQF
jgi:hypothetical protein